MKNWKASIFFVLAVLLVCLASYIAGRVKGQEIGRERGYEAGYADGYAAPHPADTVVVRDTIREDRPVPVERLVVRTDTLLVVERQTDTLLVPVPIERRTYQGDDYKAQVSGWHPSLDWIEVYPRTIYITPETPAPRRQHWGLGVTAGPGVIWNGKIHGGLGIAAGLTYTF